MVNGKPCKRNFSHSEILGPLARLGAWGTDHVWRVILKIPTAHFAMFLLQAWAVVAAAAGISLGMTCADARGAVPCQAEESIK